MADDSEDSHKHRRKKPAGTPEWSETCIGIWTTNNKGDSGKSEDVKRICRGISILHLNKYADSKKINHIPTQGIEITICEEDKATAPRNLHPFLGIFVDEQDTSRKDKSIESLQRKKSDSDDKLNESNSEEATPKILQKVTENWVNRCHDAGQKIKKYYEDPRSSTEIITDVKNGMSKSYQTTARILSYCHPQEKVKQVSSFLSEHLKKMSKWWKE